MPTFLITTLLISLGIPALLLLVQFLHQTKTMTNRLHLLLLLASIIGMGLGALLVEVFEVYETGNTVFTYSAYGANLLGFTLVLFNGNLAGTQWLYVPQVIGLAVSMGVLFKMMHWPGANLLLMIGGFGLLLFYTGWTIAKGSRIRLLDVIKWLWVLFWTAGSLVVIMHWLPEYKWEILDMRNILLWVMLLVFLWTSLRDETLFADEE